MTMKLKLALALVCVTALTTPAVMATPAEFVPQAPNLPPDPTRPVVTPMVGTPFPSQVPEPGSLPLVVAAVTLAAAFSLRRKK